MAPRGARASGRWPYEPAPQGGQSLRGQGLASVPAGRQNPTRGDTRVPRGHWRRGAAGEVVGAVAHVEHRDPDREHRRVWVWDLGVGSGLGHRRGGARGARRGGTSLPRDPDRPHGRRWASLRLPLRSGAHPVAEGQRAEAPHAKQDRREGLGRPLGRRVHRGGPERPPRDRRGLRVGQQGGDSGRSGLAGTVREQGRGGAPRRSTTSQGRSRSGVRSGRAPERGGQDLERHDGRASRRAPRASADRWRVPRVRGDLNP